MKNIVVLTRGYYPNMSPMTSVLDMYIQQMKGRYRFQIVATPSATRFDPLEDSFIKVHYINDKWYNLRLKCEERYSRNPSFINKLVILLFRARTAVMSYFVDDYVTGWEEDASYFKLKEVYEQDKFDTMISLSGYITHSHLAAKRFKVEHPQVKWITFFTDPITFQNPDFYPKFFNFEKMRKKRYQKELGIYNSADYNILVEDLYPDALTKFNQPRNKTICFRYVLDDIRNQVQLTQMPKTETIRLIYAGALYKLIRNPEYMLSVVSQIEGVSLDMFVRSYECVDIIEKYLSDSINLYPGANTKRYKEMICYEYDVLVSIGNNCTNQSPSKTLELLSSGRPIINFYSYKDSQYWMIEKYPLGLNIENGETDAVNKVKQFCKDMKGRQLSYSEVETIFPDNTIQKQLPILEKLINN